MPFLDLSRALRADMALIERAVSRTVEQGQLILGPEVAAFERAFADFCGVRHCVGVGNGLDALTMMLEASGIGPGDEVIVPGNTYIATWLAVSAVGARVVPVDPDIATFNLTVAGVTAALTGRTRAVLTVHLYGLCAEMEELESICRRRGIHLLADAAQAAGATVNGRPCGSFAEASAFSFYPTKNLAALGDGGAVLTSNDDVAARLRLLRNYGSMAKDQHPIKGRNSRLDEVQAAVLLDRLRLLPGQQAQRVRLSQRYLDALRGIPFISLPTGSESGHAWHLFTLRIAGGRRDALRAGLHERGIGTGIYYPTPPHRQAAYARESTALPPLPLSERLAGEVLSLPMNAYLTEAEADAVIAAVRECVASWA